MQTRYYDDKDFEVLNEWLAFHGHDQVKRSDLPKIGYVAYTEINNTITLAAIAFIRLAEGNFAIADSLTINPSIKSLKLKAKAFDAVVNKITEMAQNLKIQCLLAYSVKEGVVKRSTKHHNFVKVPHQLMIKKI